MGIRIAVFYAAADTGGWATLKVGGPPDAVCISHGLSSLSTVLKKAGHVPFLVDMRSFANMTGLALAVRRIDYKAAIIWASPQNSAHAHEVAKVIRAQGQPVPMVAMGGWVGGRRNGKVDGVTCTIIGEPDAVIESLFDKIEHGQPYPPEIDTLTCPPPIDAIADVDWAFFNASMQTKSPQWLPGAQPHFFTWQAGRACSACYDATVLGRKYRCAACGKNPIRMHDPRCLIDSVHRLAGSDGTGGIGLFAFHDTCWASAKWLRAVAIDWASMIGQQFPVFLPIDPRAICDDPSIITEWRKCGLTWVTMDALCGNDAIRNAAGEAATSEQIIYAADIVHRNRVNLLLHVTAGLPGEVPNDILSTEALVQKCQPQVIDARIWRPTVDSAMWLDAAARGLVADESLPHPLLGSGYRFLKQVDYRAAEAAIASWPGKHVTPLQCISVVAQQRSGQEMAPPLPPPPGPVAPTATSLTSTTPTGTGAPKCDWREDAMRQVDALLAAESGPEPKVTVITAIHRQLEFFKEAFASIEAQTMRAKGGLIEWVIVESCSPRQDLRDYLAMKSKMRFENLAVKVVNLKENVNNIAVSWNIGLDLARGEYVCLLDADNRKRPGFLETLCGWLDAHPDRVAVRCKTSNIDAGGVAQSERGNPGELDLGAELAGNWVDSGEFVVRRSLFTEIGPFDDRMKACEDWDFVARVVARSGGMGFVDEVLTEKRSHAGNRLLTSHQLGAVVCTELLRTKNKGSWLSTVRIVAPSDDRLTASQRQVITGVKSGLGALKFVRVQTDPAGHSDIELVVAPFMLHGNEIDGLFDAIGKRQPRPQVVSLHMEDPQAIEPNLRMVGRADWVVANDLAAWRTYREKLASDPERRKRVLLWNCLCAPTADAATKPAGRDVDVLILGYPYPSRAALARAFLAATPTNWRVVAVGDGWEKELAGINRKLLRFRPTLPEVDTAALLRRSKICLVAHRGQGDIGGFPRGAPESVHRGFLEAGCGVVPLIDRSRAFGLGRVRAEVYDDAADAAAKAFSLLKDHKRLSEMMAWNLAHAREWAWIARIERLVHAVRTERYEAWIP